jgi:HEPN domain-containing protein
LILLIINNEQITDQYPKRTPKLDPSIPQDVGNDYVEAIKCFDVGANKASVAMCRRALQTSLIQRGAGKGKLVEQIDELSDKGILTEDIKEWAHEIRLTGNIGAHPDQDGLKDVTPQDAEELIRFMEEFLNYVYIMPAKVAAKRARKASGK